jgi:hypothetical protein
MLMTTSGSEWVGRGRLILLWEKRWNVHVWGSWKQSTEQWRWRASQQVFTEQSIVFNLHMNLEYRKRSIRRVYSSVQVNNITSRFVTELSAISLLTARQAHFGNTQSAWATTQLCWRKVLGYSHDWHWLYRLDLIVVLLTHSKSQITSFISESNIISTVKPTWRTVYSVY